MSELLDCLNKLSIPNVSYSDYKRVYSKLQRKHETWLKYAIWEYSETLNATLLWSFLLGMLLCMLGGIGYFIGFSLFGSTVVVLGLASFMLGIGLLVLASLSYNWHFNYPYAISEYQFVDMEKRTSPPAIVLEAIEVAKTLPENPLRFYFNCESFQNPKTHAVTRLWSAWVENEPRKSLPECVTYWIERLP